MAWIIIAIVLIVAVGPIFWLLPSKRDRQLGNLRTAARRAGLAVEVAKLPKLDADAVERVSAGGLPRAATVDCVAYRLPLSKPLPDAPRWLLLKSGGKGDALARELHYLDGWTTLEPPRNLPPLHRDYWPAVGAIVDVLPGGCLGVEADARRMSWFGRERLQEATVEAVAAGIRDGLDALARMHRSLDEATSDDAR